MDLKSYLKSLKPADRQDFAERCDTTVEYLEQITYGNRSPKIELAVNIERESGGVVSCESLLPKVDWKYLRGKFSRPKSAIAAAR